jgi:oxygen-independent coproporphyrinogen-3 oxidase
MLGLRLASGVNLDQFSLQVQQAILSAVKPYLKQGWVEITERDHQSAKLRLSDPEGFLFSNTILATLFEKFA